MLELHPGLGDFAAVVVGVLVFGVEISSENCAQCARPDSELKKNFVLTDLERLVVRDPLADCSGGLGDRVVVVCTFEAMPKWSSPRAIDRFRECRDLLRVEVQDMEFV